MRSIVAARPPIYYPTQLTLYRQCPERYFHRHVERRRVEEGFSPALAKGQAIHAILAEYFDTYRREGGFPTDLRDRAEYYLPRGPYPHDKAWQHDVATIIAQVEFALLSFDRTAVVVATEVTYEYAYPGSPDCPPFTLRAKVDRVIRYQDGTLEHADYKTGSGTRIDPLQNVISRIVVGQQFRGELSLILSASIFLAGQSLRVDRLTREQVQETWREIKETARAIVEAKEWPASRSPLCAWCPFSSDGCSLYTPPEDGEQLTEWLEVAAS